MSTLQWNDFMNTSKKILNVMYGEDINEFMKKIDQSNEFDTFFLYKLLGSGDKMRDKFTDILHEIVLFENDKHKTAQIIALSKWLRDDDIFDIIDSIFTKKIPINREMIERLWSRIDDDIFLHILLDRIVPYNATTINYQNQLSTEDEINILGHIKINIIWLWFYVLSYYCIHHILSIWNDTETLHSFYKSLIDDNKNKDRLLKYHYIFLPATVKYAINGGLTKTKLDLTAYQGDMTYLLYYIFDPYHQSVDKPMGQYPPIVPITDDTLRNSEIFVIKSFIDDPINRESKDDLLDKVNGWQETLT